MHIHIQLEHLKYKSYYLCKAVSIFFKPFFVDIITKNECEEAYIFRNVFFTIELNL